MNSRAKLVCLTVEYLEQPLGIDVTQPRFGWQMQAPSNSRGFRQTAYQIVVRNPSQEVVWDSGKVSSGLSVGIRYHGQPLQAATRYAWTVTVWDQDSIPVSANSWFETGLMDPTMEAWEGARWIGGTDADLPFHSQVFPVFRLKYKQKLLPGSTRGSIVFGANDCRLMDCNKNIYNLCSGRNESYLQLELDISKLTDNTGPALLHIYRSGYHPDDDPERPLASLPIPLELINQDNQYDEHHIEIDCLTGALTIYLNGRDQRHCIAKGFIINPVIDPSREGYDFISFPMVADIGFALSPGQQALFRDLIIENYRSPNSRLFGEDLTRSPYDGIFRDYVSDSASGLTITEGSYLVRGGSQGVIITADPSRNSMPMLRSEFTALDRPITQARLYITARGIYRAYLNGQQVGDLYFTPDFTQYDRTHMYQTYDVTDLIRDNDSNAIGVVLGEGWWSGYLSYNSRNWNYFGDRQSLLAKLVIDYADGQRQAITTDPRTWQYYHDGPIVYASFFQGETYNALKESAVAGWALPGFDASRWKPAREVTLEGTAFLGRINTEYSGSFEFNYHRLNLVGQIGPSPRVFTVLTAQMMHQPRPGVFVYDMGQNMVGVPKITIENIKPGTKVTLRYSEMLYPDLPESGANVGMVMMENYRAAHSHDVYIAKGGLEVIQPHFTFHGYRYLEITGIDQPLPLEAVQGLVISSVTRLTADYQTSNPLINRLWRNIIWSTLGNFLSIPTDCPQRNERMGWSGDISVFSRTAVHIADAMSFLARHMVNMRDTQAAGGRFGDTAPMYGEGFGGLLWGSAGIVIPWELYQQYGDPGILAENYPAMKAYMEYLDTVTDANGLITDSLLGDWLGPENSKNETHFLVTAYHIYDLKIMAASAQILGLAEDAANFKVKFEQRKQFFNRHFVNDKHRTVRFDGTTLIDTQTSYGVGLALGAFADDTIPDAQRYLVEAVQRENRDDQGIMRPAYTLMTGFIGTAWISTALSNAKADQEAYRLLQQTAYPSWLYPVVHGATTIWERLDGYTVEKGFGGHNGMNSFNHYSFGAVGQWLIAYSLGIQRDEQHPGFKHFFLRPTPDPDRKTTYAKGHYDSAYGRIESSWQYEDGQLVVDVTVPANTTATIYIPTVDHQVVLESGVPAVTSPGVAFLDCTDGKTAYRLESGSYRFTVANPT